MSSPPKRAKMTNNENQLLIFVGSCSFGDADTRAVSRLFLDRLSGQLSIAGPAVELPSCNPGWLEWRSPFKHMYCGFENSPGSVQAFTFDPGSGDLEAVGKTVSSVGRHPCHLSLDMSGKWLFTANYTEGSVAVLPIGPDGAVGAATDSKMHQGGDLIPSELHDRQERAHCHQVVPHPSNKWVVVPDLGLSKVFVYAFDCVNGALRGAADDPRHLQLNASAGCRHAVWNQVGDVLFVNNELDTSVTVCTFDVASGALTATQTVSSLPVGSVPLRAHHRGNSDIQLHPSGNFLYVGCRSTDPGVIAVYKIDPESNKLSIVQHESTRGLVPRNFKLCCDGRWLIVGNQETRNVVCFKIDPASGTLSFQSECTISAHKACNISVPFDPLEVAANKDRLH